MEPPSPGSESPSTQAVLPDNGGDSSSAEMDLADTPLPSPQPQDQPSEPLLAACQPGLKRKLGKTENTNSHLAGFDGHTAKKQRKVKPSSIVELPVPMLQLVFSHLSPAMLCRCMLVCKTFHKALTDCTKHLVPPRTDKYINSEDVWKASRCRYTNLPRPLEGFSEVEMIRLIGGKTCQVCHRLLQPSKGTSTCKAGPGPHGVRVIWPFGIRTCGKCLEKESLKDTEVIVNPSFAPLRHGIAHGFRTPDLHFIPNSVLTKKNSVPSSYRASKIYSKKALEMILAKYQEVKMLGDGATTEWLKGLPRKGKDLIEDSARWEEWESNLGHGMSLAETLKAYDPSLFPDIANVVRSRSAGKATLRSATDSFGAHPLPQPVFSPDHFPPRHPLPNAPIYNLKAPKNMLEVEEARKARKAAIERRCLELQPPLEPRVLRHMEAFRAAMQIGTPLTDAAWKVLLPRLTAQREAAELKEYDLSQQAAAFDASRKLPDHADSSYIDELPDPEYEQAQVPLRQKLFQYAAEFIDQQFAGGTKLNSTNAPLFTVRVILEVVDRYKQDEQINQLPTSFAGDHVSKAGRHSAPFLSLDNMKSVMDAKIRPLTDPLRKELFICAGCPNDKAQVKWYAFESLIQHYGAKHTTDFGTGNIVVNWKRAKWPDIPPFHDDPSEFMKPERRYNDTKAHSKGRPVHNDYQMPASTHLPVKPSTPLKASPLQPATNPQHDIEIETVSFLARELWDSIFDVRGILGAVRMQTIVYHLADQFKKIFGRRLDIEIFIEAMAVNASLDPLRASHDLACAQCVSAADMGRLGHGGYYVRIKDSPLLNLLALLKHWKLVHQAQVDVDGERWITGMIEVPEPQLIAESTRAPGMNSAMRYYLTGAFPLAFPTSTTSSGVAGPPPTDTTSQPPSVAKSVLDLLHKKHGKSQPKKKKAPTTQTTSGMEDFEGAPPEPTEDEYDPRRPIFAPPEENETGNSRYDTDARDRTSSANDSKLPTNPLPTANGVAEALKIMEQKSILDSMKFPNRRPSRAPSTGRRSPDLAASPRRPSKAEFVQPDIAAILRQLQQNGLPQNISTSAQELQDAASNAMYQPKNSAQRPPVKSQYHEEHHHPSSRVASAQIYNGSSDQEHGASRYHSPPAQAINTFDRGYQRSYAEPHAVSQTRSPPRYQSLYPEEPAAAAPVYGEVPIQHAQPAPAYGPPLAPRYWYESTAPPPMLVDENGRLLQLIPIDGAPATVHHPQYQPRYPHVRPNVGTIGNHYLPHTYGPTQPAGSFYQLPPAPAHLAPRTHGAHQHPHYRGDAHVAGPATTGLHRLPGQDDLQPNFLQPQHPMAMPQYAIYDEPHASLPPP